MSRKPDMSNKVLAPLWPQIGACCTLRGLASLARVSRELRNVMRNPAIWIESGAVKRIKKRDLWEWAAGQGVASLRMMHAISPWIRADALSHQSDFTPLGDACADGDLEKARWLAETFEFEAEDARALDCQALEAAAVRGHFDVVHWLVETFGLTAQDTRWGQYWSDVDHHYDDPNIIVRFMVGAVAEASNPGEQEEERQNDCYRVGWRNKRPSYLEVARKLVATFGDGKDEIRETGTQENDNREKEDSGSEDIERDWMAWLGAAGSLCE